MGRRQGRWSRKEVLMKRTMVWTVSSLVALAAAMVLTGCSSGGGGNNTPPDVTMNVTTVTGIPAIPGAVDGAGFGPGKGSAFIEPMAGTVISGVLYMTDPGNHVIKAVDLTTNTVTTFAGTVGVPGLATGTTVSTVQFNRPTGIVSRGTTTLFVADSGNDAVRVIDLTTNLVSTLTTSTGFGTLAGLALSPDGLSLYAADE